jgi:hypothetical protein
MKHAVLVLTFLSAACAQPEPVRRPVQVRVETVAGTCDGPDCALSPEILLDERDLRGVQLQDGEVQALVMLEFTPQGA